MKPGVTPDERKQGVADPVAGTTLPVKPDVKLDMRKQGVAYPVAGAALPVKLRFKPDKRQLKHCLFYFRYHITRLLCFKPAKRIQ